MALDPFTQSVYAEAWSLVQAAAAINPDTGRASYTASDVQAAAGDLFERASGAEAFAYRQALAGLYGMATQSAYAAQALTTADLSASIDSSMISAWPTAAPLTTQEAQPAYMAKMGFTYTTVTGEISEAYITVTGLTQVPPTVGTLQGMLIGSALTAYTTPESQGGNYLPGQQLSQFGEVTTMQLYTV
jgi:hypothetical protein